MSIENFVPKLWASALEVPFQESLIFGNGTIFDAKFQPMLQNTGNTVTINTIGAASVKPYKKTEDIEYDDVTTTATTLVMDQSKYYGFRVADIDAVQAAGDFASVSTEMHAREMARDVDRYLAKVAVDNAGNKLDALTVFNSSDYYRPAEGQITPWDVLRRFVKELNKVSAPSQNRWIVVGEDFADALLGDKHLTEAHVAGTDTVSRSGQVGSIRSLGLTIYVSGALSASDGNKEKIVAGVPGALTFATQLQKVEAMRDTRRFDDLFRGLQVYGAQAIRPSGVVAGELEVADGVLGGAGLV